MVKQKASNKRNGNKARKQQQKRTPAQSRAVAQLDAGAAAFARMLVDPCNAQMVAPPYSGMGTGEYRRFRRLFTIPTTAVEGTYTVQPATNTLLVGTHILANAGTPYTLNGQDLFNATLLGGARTETRCLGACMKVRFIGAESARAGVIGLQALPMEALQAGDVRTANDMLAISPVINRVGEVAHEVKFTPGVGDEGFSPTNNGGPYVTLRDGGCMTLTFANLPPGSLQIEITAMMEIEVGTGLVATSVAPGSRNTLNQVLHALGPPIGWAYGRVVVPTIRAMAGQAMNTLSRGSATGGAARLMLSL